MVEEDESFLACRRSDLLEGKRSVPIEYTELREEAEKTLPTEVYGYAAGGAGTENTMHENREVFDRHRIVSRALRDVSSLRLGTDLFSYNAAAPLVLSPIGRQTLFHEDGEMGTAAAAADVGIPMAVSTTATHPIEDVAETADGSSLYFQLYWQNDWNVAKSLVQRAEAAGFDGIVLTVDSKIPKWRPRNLRNAYLAGSRINKSVLETDPIVQALAEEAEMTITEFVHQSPALDDDPTISWDDLGVLREWTDLPIILKGILRVDDARRAAEWGADGIVVSNHGGRQIDGAVSPVTQLPKIAEVSARDTTVILDSGVRTGADIFKALALGADAVQIGRPFLYGLAIAGERGVREVVLNLLAELESIVGLSGYSSVDQIDANAVVPRV